MGLAVRDNPLRPMYLKLLHTYQRRMEREIR